MSTASSPAGQSSQNPTTSGTTGSSRLSFGAYRMKKEQERLSCSPKGSVGKKLKKTTSNNNTAAQVKVNVGIVTLRDGRLLPKRSTMLPLNVDNLVGSKELLDKAVENHSRFNSQLVSNNPSMYKLLYGNIAQMQEVKTIPGLKELFSLKRYKDKIGKPYSKLTFYICSLKDYLVDFINLSSDEEIDESSTVPFYTDSMSSRNESTTESDCAQQQTQCTSVQVVEVVLPEPTQSQTVQCPICLNHFNIQEIQHHTEDCSKWFLDEGDEILELDSFDNDQTISEKEIPMRVCDMEKNVVKQMIKEDVSKVANLNLEKEGQRRLTVRRKSIWEDFKDELLKRNRITPSSRIKVVFSGEPAVDDGGPRRELFSGIVFFISYCFHHQ